MNESFTKMKMEDEALVKKKALSENYDHAILVPGMSIVEKGPEKGPENQAPASTNPVGSYGRLNASMVAHEFKPGHH